MTNRPNKDIFATALDAAPAKVEAEAIRIIEKILIDGLPRGVIGTQIWHSNEPSSSLSLADKGIVANLGARLAKLALNSICDLFLNTEVRAALLKDANNGQLAKMRNERSRTRTAAIKETVLAMREKSSKDIERELVLVGLLEYDDDNARYRYPGTEKSFSAKSLDSKISRIKREGSAKTLRSSERKN